MSTPSRAGIERALADLRRQLSEQDAAFREARRELAALGDIQLAFGSPPEFSHSIEVNAPPVGLRG